MTGRIVFTLAATLMLSGTSFAQDQSNRVAAETDWAVFEGNEPKECWAVTAPKETVNTRDSNVVSVRRGDILLFVTHRPGTDVRSELSFTGGYPFADGSNVTLEIGGATFQMFTEGEWAWPGSADEDSKIVAAMKRGAQAVLTGRSGRGTVTKDTFSLLGFTAAEDEAAKRCAS